MVAVCVLFGGWFDYLFWCCCLVVVSFVFRLMLILVCWVVVGVASGLLLGFVWQDGVFSGFCSCFIVCSLCFRMIWVG